MLQPSSACLLLLVLAESFTHREIPGLRTWRDLFEKSQLAQICSRICFMVTWTATVLNIAH